MLIILLFLVGLIIGSFLNVCVFRIPAGQSINYPPSHCSSCDHRLSWKDLVPVVSYASLRGRCRYCGEKISIQYPLIEITTGFLFAWTVSVLGITPHAVLTLVIFSCLLVVAVIDIRTMEISISMVYTLIIIAVIHMLIVNPGWSHWRESLLGVFVGSGSMLVLYLVVLLLFHKEILGMGDIKLFVPIGLYLGMERTLLCIYLSCVIGGLIGGYLLITGRKKRGEMLPFAPFIVAAVMITTLYGGDFLSFYFVHVLNR